MPDAVSEMLRGTWSSTSEKSKQWLLLKIFRALRTVRLVDLYLSYEVAPIYNYLRLSGENVALILDILRAASQSKAHGVDFQKPCCQIFH
jgi:hypothetical protein